MGLGQILVLWLGIVAGTVFPILLVLWIVYVIREPGRKREQARVEREELEWWSARFVRMDLTDAEWEELQDAR